MSSPRNLLSYQTIEPCHRTVELPHRGLCSPKKHAKDRKRDTCGSANGNPGGMYSMGYQGYLPTLGNTPEVLRTQRSHLLDLWLRAVYRFATNAHVLQRLPRDRMELHCRGADSRPHTPRRSTENGRHGAVHKPTGKNNPYHGTSIPTQTHQKNARPIGKGVCV